MLQLPPVDTEQLLNEQENWPYKNKLPDNDKQKRRFWTRRYRSFMERFYSVACSRIACVNIAPFSVLFVRRFFYSLHTEVCVPT